MCFEHTVSLEIKQESELDRFAHIIYEHPRLRVYYVFNLIFTKASI